MIELSGTMMVRGTLDFYNQRQPTARPASNLHSTQKTMPVESHFSHLLIIEDDKGRREFFLDAETYSIGRDPHCDLRLISQFVSRHHATLVKKMEEDGNFRYEIVDGALNGKPSANGLLINGRKASSHYLQNEDEVVFGPKVRAVYYQLSRDAIVTSPPDEFDITLISPNMLGEMSDDLDDDYDDLT
jgi:pSer/pThr/pTyr-binding forkhead associated (FHA) protein